MSVRLDVFRLYKDQSVLWRGAANELAALKRMVFEHPVERRQYGNRIRRTNWPCAEDVPGGTPTAERNLLMSWRDEATVI